MWPQLILVAVRAGEHVGACVRDMSLLGLWSKKNQTGLEA